MARRFRSVLYLPADRARVFEKARGLPADALIFDLEDAVTPEAKPEARKLLSEQLGEGGFGDRSLIARVNALSSGLAAEDLAALSDAPVDAVLFPKIDDAADVDAAAAAMRDAGIAKSVQIWAMIETPRAVLNLSAIAARAADTALTGFVLGLNDLSKDTGIAQVPGRAAFVPVLTMAVMAARAHDLVAIDGVCNAMDDDARLLSECEQGRAHGFDGKSLIHPRQIETANRVFSPSDAEIAAARAIVAAFADPANAGKGALRVDGAMVERLHLAQAERLLASAQDG